MSRQLHTITLSILVPYESEADADTIAEVNAAREPHDKTWDDAVERYLGGPVTDAANLLASWLPDGWAVSVS